MLRARADPALEIEASKEKTTLELEYNSSMGQQSTNASTDQEQEDRGFFAKASSLVKVAERLVPTWFEQPQGLPRIDESLKEAFETLGLKSMPISRDEIIRTHLVVEFFSSRKFERWAKHAARTNKQDCYAAMFDVLQATFNEKNVATLIILAKGSLKTRSIGKKLEMAQFEWWFSQGYEPDYILMRILDIRKPHLPRYRRIESIYRRYKEFFDVKSNFPAPEESLGGAYEVLRLKSLLDRKSGYSVKKLVVEYFKSREFKRWTEHATMLNPQDPYAAMFDVLESVHKEKQAAMILALANESRETRSIGAKLEKVQFKRWFLEKKYHPDDIPKKVFGFDPEEMDEHLWLRHAQERYRKFSIKQMIKRQTNAPIKLFVVVRPSNKQKEKLRSP
uniref:Uncharacterized protein n=1 Tax=Peronospora matthiolae TaxID=2874970 RepID=A0AAV1V7F9_9STRA